jgi:hypothetical protein
MSRWQYIAKDKLASPCPFCGCIDLLCIDDDGAFRVECGSCKSSGPEAGAMDDAIERWGSRETDTGCGT